LILQLDREIDFAIGSGNPVKNATSYCFVAKHHEVRRGAFALILTELGAHALRFDILRLMIIM